MTCSEGLVFQVPGEPVGKGRPRFTRQGRAYTPAKTAKYENLVSLAFQQMYPTKKPDTDNIAKVKDALNGIAFKDDSQVVKETIIKRYAEVPKLVIYIKEV